MKKMILTALVILLAFVTASADEPAAAAFEKMKALAGNWETNWDGKVQPMSLKVISAGSALMQTDEAESMVTMFHLDGSRLMMTHYCAEKNQPRMTADLRPDGSIEFKFLDVTNLKSKDAGHMRRMILTFKDADHFSEEWFFAEKGVEGKGATFQYTRKK